MVKGLAGFKEWFEGYEEQYVIIGGTACDILMSETGISFRATKDIDLVLILEALNPEFGKQFWEYVIEAGYEHCKSSSGEPVFYRFSKPKSEGFPAMIELFSRKMDSMFLPDDAILEPLHIGDEISSLSAILLEKDYYDFLRSGKTVLDGVSVLSAEYIIPFKMKAWLELSARKANGENVDSKNIKKHKNDVFRLTELLYPETRVLVPETVYYDIREFISHMETENIQLKKLGVVGQEKEEILKGFMKMYILNSTS